MSIDENKAVVRRAVEIFDTLEAGALEDVLSSRNWLRACTKS